jgi:hypothetical protein
MKVGGVAGVGSRTLSKFINRAATALICPLSAVFHGRK